MENLKVAIWIDRAAAVRAGRAAHGRQVVTLSDADLATLTPEEREVVATAATREGAIDLASTTLAVSVCGAEGVRAALVLEMEERARAAAERQTALDAAVRTHEARIVEWLALPLDKRAAKPWASAYGDRYNPSSPWAADDQRAVFADPRCAIALAEAQAECDRLNAESAAAEARADEAADQKRRADAATKAAKAATKAAAIRAWTEQAPPELHALERLDAGALAEEEAVAGITDLAMAPITAERYDRLAASDIDCEHCGADPEAKFDSTDNPTLDAAQWERLTALRSMAGEGATVTPRLHEGWCDRHPEKQGCVERYGALVRCIWHGLTVSREFAL